MAELPLAKFLKQPQVGPTCESDLATVHVVFAMLTDGEMVTQECNLGAGTDNFGGLNRHSTTEADISPNRDGAISRDFLIQKKDVDNGTLNPPPSVLAKVVHDKLYFTEAAPVYPSC